MASVLGATLRGRLGDAVVAGVFPTLRGGTALATGEGGGSGGAVSVVRRSVRVVRTV